MPDWTYQPIFKPLLFRLPPRQARDLTLGVTGMLGSFHLGRSLLDFMGDMRPHESLAVEAAGLRWPSRVGVSAGLVNDAGTILAFSQFGIGHIEVGPITVSPVVPEKNAILRDEQNQSISYESAIENPGMEKTAAVLRRVARATKARLGVRLTNQPDSNIDQATNEYCSLARTFSPSADFLTVDTRWWQPSWNEEEIVKLLTAIKADAGGKLVLLLVSPNCDEKRFQQSLNLARQHLIGGFVVGGGIKQPDESMRICGRPAKEVSLQRVLQIADEEWTEQPLIIASGGIIEPQDALDFFNAGAQLVQLHSGLVFSGPGLPKRINESFSFIKSTAGATTLRSIPLSTKLAEGWVGFTLVSIGLIIAAVTVICVGLTRVLLPYDEAFIGVAMAEIPKINSHLLKFMSHDRVTLGGTSLSGAILFFCLAVFGVRSRHRWAFVAEVAGLIAGFMAFFLYLGFKYFDPLHALVCILTFPFFIWGIVKRPAFVAEKSSNLHNDNKWRMSLIGQLMFVSIGAGLLMAGITIAYVGCTTIFVREDLSFMETARCTLANVNPHLLPLIAHDRASFGGCLWAVGTVELLTSLYGYRPGNRWVWWTLAIGGLPGFICVMGIHVHIGYTSFIHLLPAYIAFAMYLTGLYCSYGYLCRRDQLVAPGL